MKKKILLLTPGHNEKSLFFLVTTSQLKKICKTALQKFGKTQLRTPIPEKRVGSGVSWHYVVKRQSRVALVVFEGREKKECESLIIH